jgi:hypothetical protein
VGGGSIGVPLGDGLVQLASTGTAKTSLRPSLHPTIVIKQHHSTRNKQFSNFVNNLPGGGQGIMAAQPSTHTSNKSFSGVLRHLRVE